jgi:chloramphenicol 3-O-phosphotransferase
MRCDPSKGTLVLITGAPAAGKSTLGRALAQELDLSLLSKDEIKESLFETLGTGDVDWSKRLGAAAIEILLLTARKQGSAIIECNFNPDYASRITALGRPVVEIFCRVPPELATRRFAERARHPGHRDAERLHEVEAWIESATPLGLGPVLEVDTSERVDAQKLCGWVRGHIA